jgi:phosphatidylserine decarboxylase
MLATLGIVLITVSVLLFLFWKVVFLRNPQRTTPAGDFVIAPADGKIVEILELKGEEVKFFKGGQRLLGIINTFTNDVADEGYIISIFMSPMDVHVNRAPISGTVESVVHSAGKFLAVNTFEAGLVNEKTETIIQGKIRVKMIQIAGFLARRVVTSVNPNDQVVAGQEVGLINLGSQVTVIVPKSVTLKVTKGDRTVAGETILAKINS